MNCSEIVALLALLRTGRRIAEHGAPSLRPMSELGSLSHSATRLAVVIERVADALLVEDEPAPRPESVSIVPARELLRARP
jgi:hypothetical protein